MDTKPLRLFSYTRSSSDSTCERQRYYAREWGGTGLQPIGPSSWDILHGNLGHQALEQLAKTGTCDFMHWRKVCYNEALKAGLEPILARDWGALLEGQLRGFYRIVWPGLLAEYDIIGAEKWIELTLPNGFQFRARQDLLLKSKFDGHLCYVDYKFTGSTKPQWIKSWNKSIQLHSSMFALNQSTDYSVDRGLVIGISKGWKDEKKNLRRSPFTYGYANREFSMSPEYSYEYQRSRGWEMFSTADEFEDLSGWVEAMPTPLLTEQFPRTAPIFLREDMAKDYLRQQLIREAEVADACQQLEQSTDINDIEAILDKYFRQDFDQCEPAYGFGCDFAPLCWQPWVKADPLGSKLFERYKSDLEEPTNDTPV